MARLSAPRAGGGPRRRPCRGAAAWGWLGTLLAVAGVLPAPAFAGAAAGSAGVTGATAAHAAPLEARAVRAVRDDAGLTVRLPAPAQRIVSLAPHITENLFALGLGERIVGADEYSDYPAPARRIARIGRAGALDVERIAALHPDLVVAWGSGSTAAQVAALRRLGLPVFISEAQSPEGVAANLRALGHLAGVDALAESRADTLEAGFAALRARYAGAPPLRVFYQIWHAPLMTINRQHSIAAVLRLCGGVNIFDALPTLAPTVSSEAVLRADPQVIIGSGSDATDSRWRDVWQHWPQLAAVRLGGLIDIPPDLMQRPTPRLLDGAQQVCAALAAVRARAAQAGK